MGITGSGVDIMEWNGDFQNHGMGDGMGDRGFRIRLIRIGSPRVVNGWVEWRYLLFVIKG